MDRSKYPDVSRTDSIEAQAFLKLAVGLNYHSSVTCALPMLH
jgi:hypothetical protein